jgi:hypothetical protein
VDCHFPGVATVSFLSLYTPDREGFRGSARRRRSSKGHLLHTAAYFIGYTWVVRTDDRVEPHRFVRPSASTPLRAAGSIVQGWSSRRRRAAAAGAPGFVGSVNMAGSQLGSAWWTTRAGGVAATVWRWLRSQSPPCWSCCSAARWRPSKCRAVVEGKPVVVMRSISNQLAVVVGTIAVALTMSGCFPGRERICSKGEHVVKSIEAPETGRTCVRDGEPPPPGYEEYPPGSVPTYTDEG